MAHLMAHLMAQVMAQVTAQVMAHFMAHVMRGSMFCKWIQTGSAGLTDCACRDRTRPNVAGS